MAQGGRLSWGLGSITLSEPGWVRLLEALPCGDRAGSVPVCVQYLFSFDNVMGVVLSPHVTDNKRHRPFGPLHGQHTEGGVSLASGDA